MKYVILNDYNVGTLYDSVETAEKIIGEYYEKGGQASRFIAGVIKGFETKIPVNIRVVEVEDIGKLVQDINRLEQLDN